MFQHTSRGQLDLQAANLADL